MPFSERTAGKVICIVCRTADGHAAACPLVELDKQVTELTAHVGTFVGDMRDTMERIRHLLRDEPTDPTTGENL